MLVAAERVPHNPLSRNQLLACGVIFLVGAVLRAFFTLDWHDPRDFIYSDMGIYMTVAERMANPGAILGPADVTHPPAASLLLSWFLRVDPTLQAAVVFQLVLSVLTPLAVAALAWVAFGTRAAALALALSSFYFPFIEYAGFFLAEVHFTLLLAVTLTLAYAALGASRPASRYSLALAAGLGFALMVTFKMVAVPAFAAFWFSALAWTRDPESGSRDFRRKRLVLAVFALGALPVLIPAARFCTEINAGNFCIAGNKGPSDVLLGHYGRIGRMQWTDFAFGNPPAVSRGYTTEVKLDFSLTDSERNLATAAYWVREHPLEALALSLDHVYDTFAATPSWPGEATSFWAWDHLFAHFYLAFLFAPLAYATVETLRRQGIRALLASREFLIFSPIFGLVAAVFLTSGEPRYRNPFDVIFVVLVCSLGARVIGRRRAA